MAFRNGPNVITKGLVLCLDAGDKNSYPGSGTTWFDLSGKRNHGTLINGPTFSNTNGGGIVFDGSNDYAEIVNQMQFERTNSFSFCSWVKSSTASNTQIINNENTSYRGYQFMINSGGNLLLFLRNEPGSNFIGVVSSDTLSPNTWYHLACTYSGSSLASGVSLYVNGIPQTVTVSGDNLTRSIISNETTLIGIRRPATTGPFNGSIGLVQIYNRVLSAAEIAANYNAQKSRFNL